MWNISWICEFVKSIKSKNELDNVFKYMSFVTTIRTIREKIWQYETPDFEIEGIVFRKR